MLIFDKLAKDKNRVKSSVNRQDLFVRTVDAEEMETIDSEEIVMVLPTM